MNKKPETFVANAEVIIHATLNEVWNALVDPAAIKQYMFGTDIQSAWKPGADIIWQGEWQGKKYKDHGKILSFQPQKELSYSHFSPLSGLPDTSENYHHVTIRVAEENSGVRVFLEQDNNATIEARDHSQKNWQGMLDALKKYVEST